VERWYGNTRSDAFEMVASQQALCRSVLETHLTSETAGRA
jgi:hypothetical protein